MMVSGLEQITLLIIRFRYAILFPAAAIEGPIVTAIAGFLAAQGYMNLVAVYLVVIMADISADIFYYYVGALSEARLAQRIKARFGITPARIDHLKRHFALHGFKTFLAGKLLHGPGLAVLVTAGAARVPFNKFLVYNIVITLLKSLVFVLFGYFFGQALGTLQGYLDLTALLALAIIIIVLAFLIIRRRYRKKEPIL